MRPFLFGRAPDAVAALEAAASSDSAFLSGGTTLTDLMKLDVVRADRLVDVTAMAGPDLSAVTFGDRTLHLGALATMADVADHPRIRSDCPVIAQALQLAASQQIRNMARLGGNVLQRTRCGYFRDVGFAQCNKRIPGSGCAALDGHNRQNAVLGTSAACVATYAGDFAQALIALDATVILLGRQGVRRMAFSDLHRLPGDAPDVETSLASDDLIVGFEIERRPWHRRSIYLKVRDRDSYAFALASAAVVLDLDGDHVRDVRIALGGVATVPWRAKEAEDLLKGTALDEAAAHRAAKAAFSQARPLSHNGFKVTLGEQTVVRALLQAAELKDSQ